MARIRGKNSLTGRQYRMMNEVPTLLMVIIVVSVISFVMLYETCMG